MRVFSANVAPIIDDEGNEVYAIEAKLEVFNDFIGTMINILKSRELMSRLSRLVSESPNLEGVLNVLRLLNDLIVIYFKRTFTVPLAPPVKVESLTYVPTSSDLLYSYVIARDLGLLSEEAVARFLSRPLVELSYEDLNNFTKAVISGLGSDVVREVFSIRPPHEVYERFRDLVMGVPADTRPGLNVSKLIPHILLTSAIASVKYINRVKSKDRLINKLHLELLRLASLLHDIGKPKAWLSNKSHTRESAEVVNSIFKDVIKESIIESGLSDDVKSELLKLVEGLGKVITEIVLKHHKPQEVRPTYLISNIEVRAGLLANILSDADKAASTTERLLNEVVKVLAESNIIKSKGIDRNTLINALRKVGPEAWSFWRGFTDDEIRSLSEEVVKKLGDEAVKLVEAYEEIKDVKVLMLDVKGIQSFIRRESLRSVAAASTLIDLLVLYVAPKALIDALQLPIESFIFMGGGNLIVLVPSYLTEDGVRKLLSNLNLGVKIDLSVALAPFTIPWIVTQRQLMSRLASEKIMVRYLSSGAEDVVLGYEVMCESCRRRPAKEVKGEVGVREKYCEECFKLLNFGRSMYIKYKLSILKNAGYVSASKYLANEDELKKLHTHLMEWLSGAEDYLRSSRYLGVVKIDGNVIGSYMAYSLTPAEAFLRSMRIDLGTKLGIYALLESILKKADEEGNTRTKELLEDLATRVFSGILYAGGDDLLALTPAHLTIPLCLSVAYWFWRLTGTRTVSAGIACGKPKHNVWLLIDTANRLLSKSKEKFRKELISGTAGTNTLIHLYFELGTQQLLPSVVNDVVKTYGASGLYREPYIMTYKATGRGDSLELPFKILGIISDGFDLRRKVGFEELLSNLLNEIVRSETIRRVRGIIAKLLISIKPSLSTTPLINVWTILATKLSWRAARIKAGIAGDEVEFRVLKELANLMLNEYRLNKKYVLPPLRDLLVLMNILLNER